MEEHVPVCGAEGKRDSYDSVSETQTQDESERLRTAGLFRHERRKGNHVLLARRHPLEKEGASRTRMSFAFRSGAVRVVEASPY